MSSNYTSANRSADGWHALRRWSVLVLTACGLAALVVGGMSIADTPADNSPTASAADVAVDETGWLPISAFLQLDRYPPDQIGELLGIVDANWRSGYAPMLQEAGRFSRYRGLVVDLLRRKAGPSVGSGRHALWHWVWRSNDDPHPNYADFKSQLYRPIDSRFANYFTDDRATTIDLAEVQWGGVIRDGIPPLKNPKMLAAEEADYLAQTDVVFGLEVNGDARAYPKRILAWHEMFKDTVGGVSVNCVYCTLCGMMILYETEFDGVHHELGTSGFLYRSNKLMYDAATESMWSTTRGEPVVGPLVCKGIRLKTRPVVSTTWGEWRRRHPDTTVLSLDTGHRRDYGEGIAYRSYFASDKLMFTVPDLSPHQDATKPLSNKLEVLALRFGDAETKPTAIASDFLAGNPVFQGEHGGVLYVVLTDKSGANRTYEAGEHRFLDRSAPDEALIDEAGTRWMVKEDRLVGESGEELPRLPTHRAFWFGWRAAHPDTRLIGG